MSDRFRIVWSEGTGKPNEFGAVQASNSPVSLLLMIVGVILIVVGFFFKGSFEDADGFGELTEKFAFLVTGIGVLTTGSIFWNADRIVNAAKAR